MREKLHAAAKAKGEWVPDPNFVRPLVKVVRGVNATDPDVCAATSPAPAKDDEPPPSRTVVYQSTGVQTLPPGDEDAFEKCYGRLPDDGEAGLGAKGRYLPGKVDPHELCYGEAFIVPQYEASEEKASKDEASKSYTSSLFQTMEFKDRTGPIRKAKAKATLIAKKYQSVAKEEGYRIFAETDNRMVVHSEQFPIKVKLDKNGMAKGYVGDVPRLPNVVGEKLGVKRALPAGQPGASKVVAASTVDPPFPIGHRKPIPVIDLSPEENRIVNSAEYGIPTARCNTEKGTYVNSKGYEVKYTFNEYRSSAQADASAGRPAGQNVQPASKDAVDAGPDTDGKTSTALPSNTLKRKATDQETEEDAETQRDVKRARFEHGETCSSKKLETPAVTAAATATPSKTTEVSTKPVSMNNQASTPALTEPTLSVKQPVGGGFTRDKPRFPKKPAPKQVKADSPPVQNVMQYSTPTAAQTKPVLDKTPPRSNPLAGPEIRPNPHSNASAMTTGPRNTCKRTRADVEEERNNMNDHEQQYPQADDFAIRGAATANADRKILKPRGQRRAESHETAKEWVNDKPMFTWNRSEDRKTEREENFRKKQRMK